MRDILVGAGLQEVITYSMGNLSAYAKLTPGGPEPSPDDHIRLANPLTPEREFLRRTLMSHLLETVRDNLRFRERIAIFEIGRVYWPREDNVLPEEPRHLCVAVTGPRVIRSWLSSDAESLDFFDLKGIVETLVSRLNLADVAIAPADHPTFHPGRSATLSVSGVKVGVFGEVHSDVCGAYDVEGQRVCLAEFNLEYLLATAGQPVQVRPVSLYPAVYEDLAIIVDERVPAVQVRDLIVQTGGPMLRTVELFDVYRGEQIGDSRKSLAYALTYQADDRTLDAKTIARLRRKIVRHLERELGAMLRA